MLSSPNHIKNYINYKLGKKMADSENERVDVVETSEEKWEQFFRSLLSILDAYLQLNNTENIPAQENLLSRFELCGFCLKSNIAVSFSWNFSCFSRRTGK
jgi:hypothetical protein